MATLRFSISQLTDIVFILYRAALENEKDSNQDLESANWNGRGKSGPLLPDTHTSIRTRCSYSSCVRCL